MIKNDENININFKTKPDFLLSFCDNISSREILYLGRQKSDFKKSRLKMWGILTERLRLPLFTDQNHNQLLWCVHCLLMFSTKPPGVITKRAFKDLKHNRSQNLSNSCSFESKWFPRRSSKKAQLLLESWETQIK